MSKSRIFDELELSDRLNQLMETSPTIIYACPPDLDSGLSFISSNVYNLLGYSHLECMADKLFWKNNIHPDDRSWVEASYDELRQTGKLVNEYRFRHADGHYRWMHDEMSMRLDEVTGEPIEAVCSWTDVTARKELEIRNQEQRSMAEQYLDLAKVIFVTVDTQGILRMINRAGSHILGKRTEELIGQNFFENFVPEKYRERVIRQYQSVIDGSRYIDKFYELPIINGEGEERIVIWQNVLLKDDLGNITGVLSSGEDMTEYLTIQKKIRENEELYRLLADNSTDVISIHEPDGTYKYVSPSCFNILDYTESELIGHTKQEFMHESDMEAAMQGYELLLTSEDVTTNTYRWKQKGGAYCWVESTSRSVRNDQGEVVEIICSSRDITSRKELELELQEKSTILNALLNNLPTILSKLDSQGNITYLAGMGLEKPGMRGQELIGKSLFELYPDIEKHISGLYHSATSTEFETTGILNDGPWWFRNFFMADPTSELGGLLGFSLDITNQKLVEQELHSLKETYATLLNNVPGLALFILSSHGEILVAEGTVINDLENNVGDIIGKSLDIVDKELRVSLIEPNFKKTLQGKNAVFEGMFNGHNFKVYLSPVFDEQGSVERVLAICRDVTDETHLEAKLLKSTLDGEDRIRKRMSEDLHDSLGQKLSAVRLNLVALEEDNINLSKQQQNKVAKVKQLLQEATNEVRSISHNLMPNTLSDFGLVNALEDLCNEYQGGSIEVSFQCHGEIAEMDHTSEVALYRIAQELINNAIKHANAGHITLQLHRHANSLVMSVEDDGVGFDVGGLRFDNTLGFYNITSRAKALNGRLDIESQPKIGTLVSLEIPL